MSEDSGVSRPTWAHRLLRSEEQRAILLKRVAELETQVILADQRFEAARRAWLRNRDSEDFTMPWKTLRDLDVALAVDPDNPNT